jgi:hypothetical protein
MRTLIAIVLAVGVAITVGCKKASEELGEKMMEKALESQGGGKADVDVHEGKVTIKTKEGQFEAVSGGGARIPAGFPQDVYVLTDAKIIMASKSPTGFHVMFETGDSQDKIVARYAEEMKARDWSEESSVTMGDGVMANYKKENRGVMVMVAKDDSGTKVQVITTHASE